MPFKDSYAWKLRQKIGHDLLLIPAAGCIAVRDDGALLMVYGKDFGNWIFPGGYAEPGQSSAQVAARELLEETGVQTDTKALIPFCMLSGHTIHYGNGDIVRPFVQFYITHTWNPTDQEIDTSEISETRWFLPDELRAMTLEPRAEAEFRAYERYIDTGQYQDVALDETFAS